MTMESSAQWILYIILGITSITAAFFARHLPASGKAAASCLLVPALGYFFAWTFHPGNPLQMLGGCIFVGSAPFTVSYSLHSFRKSQERGLALVALVIGSLMALPIVWLLPMCVTVVVKLYFAKP
jgi:hypothetical protein